MAAKKQLTPEQVKAAKQKKIAIVGAVLLVAVLAFEIPKVMKMMSAKPPIVHATAPTPTGATPAAAAPATDGAAAPATSAPVSAGVDSIVVKADLSPSPLEGQLPAFTATFTSKDPFRQQVAASNPAAASTAEPGPKKPAASIVPGDSGAAAPSTAGPSAAQPPASTAPPVSAVISVNGVDSTVGVAMDFPTDAPLFTVKSLTTKAAKIAIAGGSLSSGAATITLKLDVPVTLMNTADGTRYRLVLVSTSSTAVATGPAPAAATAPATTTPATTTPATG